MDAAREQAGAPTRLPEPEDAVPVAVSRPVIVRAFDVWHPTRYPDASVPSSALELAHDALEEMFAISTQMFDDWWLRNHYRYNHLREIDRRRVREMTRAFVADLVLRKVSLGA